MTLYQRLLCIVYATAILALFLDFQVWRPDTPTASVPAPVLPAHTTKALRK